MRRLTLVGLSDDGTELLFTAEPPKSGPESRDGQYVLSLNDQLQAALRADRARLGQLQLADSAALRPREIQSRVRSGESPDEIAAATGVPVSKIMAFARPVLAEREHVAEVARVAILRRRSGVGQTLGEAVAAAVARAGGRRGDASYGAHRRPDGTWIVTVTGAGPTAGRFAFDPAARSVVPEDAAARDLVAEPVPVPPAAPVSPVAPDTRITRFDSVAVGTVAAAGAAVGAAAAVGTPARPTGGVSDEPLGSPRAAGGDDPRHSGLVDAEPPTPHREGGRGRRALRYLAFRDEIDEVSGGPTDRIPAGADDPGQDTVPDPDRPGDHDTLPLPTGARSARRQAVPSWDEIMFGRKDE